MARKRSQVETYEGVPLSAFEEVMITARPFIAAKDRLHDNADRLPKLKRRLRRTARTNREERNRLSQEIKDAQLYIESQTPHMNQLMDLFCQACLNFRKLNL